MRIDENGNTVTELGTLTADSPEDHYNCRWVLRQCVERRLWRRSGGIRGMLGRKYRGRGTLSYLGYDDLSGKLSGSVCEGFPAV